MTLLIDKSLLEMFLSKKVLEGTVNTVQKNQGGLVKLWAKRNCSATIN